MTGPGAPKSSCVALPIGSLAVEHVQAVVALVVADERDARLAVVPSRSTTGE